MKTLSEYKKEFQRLADIDFDFRNSPDIFSKTEEDFLKIDSVSNKFLKEFLEDYGFPSISLVGEKTSYYAWLFAQHSDFDLDFQKKYLSLMIENENDVDKTRIAYLTDRVLKNSELPQRYGTQFVFEDNKWVPYKLEDEKNVDKHRENFGLYPISEDIDYFNSNLKHP